MWFMHTGGEQRLTEQKWKWSKHKSRERAKQQHRDGKRSESCSQSWVPYGGIFSLLVTLLHLDAFGNNHGKRDFENQIL